MSGHVPAATLFDLAGLPPATALVVPVSLAAATFLRSGDDLCLIDPDGQSFTLYGYFSQDPAPLRGTDTGVLSAAAVLERTASLSVATFQPFRLFAAETLETLLTVAFGDSASLSWQGAVAEAGLPLTLAKTARAGVVTCHGIVLRLGDSITLADLRAGQVRYYHDESAVREDTLEFMSATPDEPLVLRIRLQIDSAAA